MPTPSAFHEFVQRVPDEEVRQGLTEGMESWAGNVADQLNVLETEKTALAAENAKLKEQSGLSDELMKKASAYDEIIEKEQEKTTAIFKDTIDQASPELQSQMLAAWENIPKDYQAGLNSFVTYSCSLKNGQATPQTHTIPMSAMFNHAAPAGPMAGQKRPTKHTKDRLMDSALSHFGKRKKMMEG